MNYLCCGMPVKRTVKKLKPAPNTTTDVTGTARAFIFAPNVQSARNNTKQLLTFTQVLYPSIKDTLPSALDIILGNLDLKDTQRIMAEITLTQGICTCLLLSDPNVYSHIFEKQDPIPLPGPEPPPFFMIPDVHGDIVALMASLGACTQIDRQNPVLLWDPLTREILSLPDFLIFNADGLPDDCTDKIADAFTCNRFKLVPNLTPTGVLRSVGDLTDRGRDDALIISILDLLVGRGADFRVALSDHDLYCIFKNYQPLVYPNANHTTSFMPDVPIDESITSDSLSQSPSEHGMLISQDYDGLESDDGGLKETPQRDQKAISNTFLRWLSSPTCDYVVDCGSGILMSHSVISCDFLCRIDAFIEETKTTHPYDDSHDPDTMSLEEAESLQGLCRTLCLRHDPIPDPEPEPEPELEPESPPIFPSTLSTHSKRISEFSLLMNKLFRFTMSSDPTNYVNPLINILQQNPLTFRFITEKGYVSTKLARISMLVGHCNDDEAPRLTPMTDTDQWYLNGDTQQSYWYSTISNPQAIEIKGGCAIASKCSSPETYFKDGYVDVSSIPLSPPVTPAIDPLTVSASIPKISLL